MNIYIYIYIKEYYITIAITHAHLNLNLNPLKAPRGGTGRVRGARRGALQPM